MMLGSVGRRVSRCAGAIPTMAATERSSPRTTITVAAYNAATLCTASGSMVDRSLCTAPLAATPTALGPRSPDQALGDLALWRAPTDPGPALAVRRVVRPAIPIYRREHRASYLHRARP